MRPFELLLSIAVLLTFCSLVIPRLNRVRMLNYLPGITAVLAGVQILVEGLRWQMVPMYVLVVSLFVVRLFRTFVPVKSRLRQFLVHRFIRAPAF